jgi:hypothetical protein
MATALLGHEGVLAYPLIAGNGGILNSAKMICSRYNYLVESMKQLILLRRQLAKRLTNIVKLCDNVTNQISK